MRTLAALFAKPCEVGVPPWDPRASSWHSCFHNRVVTFQPEDGWWACELDSQRDCQESIFRFCAVLNSRTYR
jgi:hypothetical protein